MNEKIQQHLDLILQKLIEASEVTVDFSKEQVPILIREILNYNIATSLMMTIVFLLVVFSVPFSAKKVLQKKKEYVSGLSNEERGWNDGEDYYYLLIAICTPLVIIAIYLSGSLFELLKVTLAPRLFLLEYLKTFLN